MRQIPWSFSGGLSCLGFLTSAAGRAGETRGTPAGGAEGSERAGVAVAVGTGLGAGRAAAVGGAGFADAIVGGLDGAPPTGRDELRGGNPFAPPAGFADVMGGRVRFDSSAGCWSVGLVTSLSSAIVLPLRSTRTHASLLCVL